MDSDVRVLNKLKNEKYYGEPSLQLLPLVKFILFLRVLVARARHNLFRLVGYIVNCES